MRKPLAITLVLALAAGAALAHQGVQNPAVMARMNLMTEIGAATKTLGLMARGQSPFDQDAAEQAAATIARHSARIPALFEAPEGDPKSEALPAIWENWEDFTAQARAMEAAAGAATEIPDLDALRSVLGKIGQTCTACHEDYRS